MNGVLKRSSIFAILLVSSLIGYSLLSSPRAKAMGIVHCAGVNSAATSGFPFFAAGNYQIDPIVSRGAPMSMHMHQFFGFTGWNTQADPSRAGFTELVGKSTSCDIPGDSAAYWAPVLSYKSNGQPVPIKRMEAYYRSWNSKLTDAKKETKTFPNDLRMVAGNAMAMTPADMDISKVAWSCGNLSTKAERTGHRYRTPEDAKCNEAGLVKPFGKIVLTVSVKFPTCWDGILNDHSIDGNTTDFSGDKMPMTVQHVKYTVKGACPAGYPHKLPQLTFVTSWDYKGNGKDIKLSSGMGSAAGKGYTFHADFLQTWVPDELQRMVTTCINTNQTDAYVHKNNADICGRPVIMTP